MLHFNKDRAIIIKKNSLWLKFNKEIETKNGLIFGIVLQVKLDNNCCFATIGTASKQDINDLHKNWTCIQVDCLPDGQVLQLANLK